MSYLLKQNSTARPLLFLMISNADHVSPATGLTPTVTISKNGAAFVTPAGAVGEVGSGLYSVAGNATDTGTLGPLYLHASATGADATDVQYEVVAFDPSDGVRLGLSSLPNAAAGAAGGLATATNSSGQPTIGGYATGQDPATLLLATAANKLATDSSGRVTVAGYASGQDPASLVLATAANKLQTNASGQVLVQMTQAVPTSNTAQTVGDALNAARAEGFGKWVLSGTSLVLYAADGTTVVRTFTLDDASNPTTRT